MWAAPPDPEQQETGPISATLRATVKASVSWDYELALTGSLTSLIQGQFSYSKELTNGTGAAGTANLIYAVQTTIAGGGNTTLDFAGSLSDWFGTTITMARLKYLYINLTTDTTASSITVGNATNPLALFSAGTATISIRNGGILFLGCSDATGIAISGGSTDELKIVNADGSNTATINLAAIGSTA